MSSDSEHTLLSLWTRAPAQPVTPHHLSSSTSPGWPIPALRGEGAGGDKHRPGGPRFWPACYTHLDLCVCAPGRGLWDCSMNRGNRPFHGRDSRAPNWHDEINQEKKGPSPPVWTHVCLTHAGRRGDSTASYGLQQTLSHIFLAPVWAQVATVSITGGLVGEITEPLARACVFVDVSNVDVTEQVNTIWGVAILDQGQSSPLTAEDDLCPQSPSLLN